MIRYKIYQGTNTMTGTEGLWYARAVCDETFDLDKLAAHMAGHNTPYSPGVILGVLKDMVSCIKELLLDGKNVKLNDLAIFSVGIHGTGAPSAEKYNVSEFVKSIALRARSTGSLSSTSLNLQATLKQLTKYGDATASTDTSSKSETDTASTETNNG